MKQLCVNLNTMRQLVEFHEQQLKSDVDVQTDWSGG